jgi:membrane protease YdiL (CAAX protease family)
MNHQDNLSSQEKTQAKGYLISLTAYFLLAFSLSWIFFIPAVTILPRDFQTIAILLGGFGPFAAALITIRIRSGKEQLKTWLKTVFRLKVPFYLYLLGGLVIPLGIGGLHTLLYLGLGGSPAFGDAEPWYLFLVFLIPTALLSGGNEEPGWRGYALPQLLKLISPLAATLILGVFHAAWHLPLLGSDSTVVLKYFFNVVPLTFLLNWCYLISSKSIWPVMLLHAGTNVLMEFFPLPMTLLGGWGDFMILRGLVVWLIAIAITIATRGRLGYAPRSFADGENS